MKLLLFLPLFILLMSCNEAEEQPNDTSTIVDDAMEVFVINKELLEDEVLFGSLCLIALKKTGSKANNACGLYYQTQAQAITMTEIGLDIFETLMNNGMLIDDEAFYEVVDIIERLSQVEATAKDLRKQIEIISGSGCIKCAI